MSYIISRITFRLLSTTIVMVAITSYFSVNFVNHFFSVTKEVEYVNYALYLVFALTSYFSYTTRRGKVLFVLGILGFIYASKNNTIATMWFTYFCSIICSLVAINGIKEIKNRNIISLPKRKRKNWEVDGFVDPTDKRFYSSQAWRELRQTAFKIHGHQCQNPNCKATHNLQVDHIKPRSKYPHLALDLNNLQILCGDCNKVKSNKIIVDFRPRKVRAS